MKKHTFFGLGMAAALLALVLGFGACDNLAGGNEGSGGITYTVAANGSADAATTALTFAFSGAVGDLGGGDITLGGGTGNVTKGALSGGGNTWTLAVTVNTAGEITAAIAKTGIEAGQKQVRVYNAEPPEPPGPPGPPEPPGPPGPPPVVEKLDLKKIDFDFVTAYGEKGTQDIIFSTINIAGKGLVSATKFEDAGANQASYQESVTRYLSECLSRMHAQYGDLINGYDAVDDVYKGSNTTNSDGKVGEYGPVLPGVSDIKTTETEMQAELGDKSDAAVYVSYAYSQLGTLFGTGDARKALDAYMAGQQFIKAKRDTPRTNARNNFVAALSAGSFTALTTNDSNLETLLGSLKSVITTHVNTQVMGDGSAFVKDTANDSEATQDAKDYNKNVVKTLNENLIIQIAEDLPELKALVADILDLGYTSNLYTTVEELIKNPSYNYAMAPQNSADSARLVAQG
jgi:hypothetical protein